MHDQQQEIPYQTCCGVGQEIPYQTWRGVGQEIPYQTWRGVGQEIRQEKKPERTDTAETARLRARGGRESTKAVGARDDLGPVRSLHGEDPAHQRGAGA